MLNRALVNQPTGGDAGQNMHAHGRFAGEFRGDVLDWAEKVSIGDSIGFLPSVGTFAIHPCFPTCVVFGSAGSAQHLTNLHHRQETTHSVIPTLEVPNEDTSCWKIDTRCKGGRGGEGHQIAFFEGGFNFFSLSVGQSCVMKAYASRKACGQIFSQSALASTGQPLSKFFKTNKPLWILLRKSFFDSFSKVSGFGLRPSSRAYKQQNLSALVQAVINHAPYWMAFQSRKGPWQSNALLLNVV